MHDSNRLLLFRLVLLLGLAVGSMGALAAEAGDFRFGLLRQAANGSYEIATETTRIPRKYKSSGLRFGLAFRNMTCREIEWFYIVELPKDAAQATGELRQAAPRTLKTEPRRSNSCSIVDEFWFDEGDPLGKHRLHMFINGIKVHTVVFEVVYP